LDLCLFWSLRWLPLGLQKQYPFSRLLVPVAVVRLDFRLVGKFLPGN
jgi:hypothetical protein